MDGGRKIRPRFYKGDAGIALRALRSHQKDLPEGDELRIGTELARRLAEGRDRRLKAGNPDTSFRPSLYRGEVGALLRALDTYACATTHAEELHKAMGLMMTISEAARKGGMGDLPEVS